MVSESFIHAVHVVVFQGLFLKIYRLVPLLTQMKHFIICL